MNLSRLALSLITIATIGGCRTEDRTPLGDGEDGGARCESAKIDDCAPFAAELMSFRHTPCQAVSCRSVETGKRYLAVQSFTAGGPSRCLYEADGQGPIGRSYCSDLQTYCGGAAFCTYTVNYPRGLECERDGGVTCGGDGGR